MLPQVKNCYVEPKKINIGTQICSKQTDNYLRRKNEMPDAEKYIAYFRVSTARQGESGLGLEAQRNSVN